MNAKRIGLAFSCLLWSLAPAHAQDGLAKIKTIVVIYAENRSFDHLYGFFPGANGIANASADDVLAIHGMGETLAESLVSIGNASGVKTEAVISAMDSPPSFCRPI